MRKSRLIKRALLTSILTLLMSVTCLIGTSFAWFTDTTSVSVKKIKTGNLDITVEAKNPNYNPDDVNSEEWIDAENQTIQWVKSDDSAIQDQANILWEPGSTYKLQELRISNTGDLALKYKIVISGIGGNAKLNEAITWSITLDGTDYINGQEQKLAAKSKDNQGNSVYASNTLKISGTMNDVGSEYQNLSIDDITITVLAAQDTVEYDSNDDEYDKESKYPAYIGPKISTSESYIGKYADIDADGTVDGVIFADLAFSKSGRWIDDNGTYSYSAIASSDLKEYYISQISYKDDFGIHEVISPVSGTTGSERFYIMALDDFDNNRYSWYRNAFDNKISNFGTIASKNFGSGKQNTSNMISAWNNKTYGEQDSNDLWGKIQTQATNGWFVPSSGEWSAFVEAFSITNVSDYSSYKLSEYYHTSSLYSEDIAHRVYFGRPYMSEDMLFATRNYTRLANIF